MTHTPKRPPGRPRKYPAGRRPTLSVRIQEAVHRELVDAAAAAGRSISEEMEHRLMAYSDVAEMRSRLRAALDQTHIQAIRRAGFQIVSDMGGEMGGVTVNVSADMLLAAADGILRSGFVEEEDLNKTPLEVTVERAVLSALQKAGLMPPEDLGSATPKREAA